MSANNPIPRAGLHDANNVLVHPGTRMLSQPGACARFEHRPVDGQGVIGHDGTRNMPQGGMDANAAWVEAHAP